MTTATEPAAVPEALLTRVARRARRIVRRIRGITDADLLRALAAQGDGDLRFAAEHLESGRTLGWHGDVAAPMASTVKVPLALTVLAAVDAERLDLEAVVPIDRSLGCAVGAGALDVALRERAPADAQVPRGLTVEALLRLALVESDNTATDHLFALVGGPGGVQAHLRALGLEGIRVDRTIRELLRDRPAGAEARGESPVESGRAFVADARDVATPLGMVAMLAALHRGRLLSPAGTSRLRAMMLACSPTSTRIRSGVPNRARVAHKSGTIAGAVTADVGLVTLAPHGTIALAAYVVGATDRPARQSATIAAAAATALAVLA